MQGCCRARLEWRWWQDGVAARTLEASGCGPHWKALLLRKLLFGAPTARPTGGGTGASPCPRLVLRPC